MTITLLSKSFDLFFFSESKSVFLEEIWSFLKKPSGSVDLLQPVTPKMIEAVSFSSLDDADQQDLLLFLSNTPFIYYVYDYDIFAEDPFFMAYLQEVSRQILV